MPESEGQSRARTNPCRVKASKLPGARSTLQINDEVERSTKIAATRTAALPDSPEQSNIPIIDIALFSRPWDLALLGQCFLGVRRFDQFQKRLGISRKTLSKRLSLLVEDGILSRELYQSRPERFEYLLTDKGCDLFPIVLAIKRWGERWGGSGEMQSHNSSLTRDR